MASNFADDGRPGFGEMGLLGRNADPSGKAGFIAAEIEKRLMLGQYRFVEALSAAQLAQQFDASRQPVSAAIAPLVRPG